MTNGDVSTMPTDEEGELEGMAKLFINHVNEREYDEAYGIFRRNPDVVLYAQVADLSLIYIGFRGIDENAAREFKDYVIKHIRSWDVDHWIDRLLRETAKHGGLR